ncbi:MAG: hypothetical protein HC802_19155, partial [Caldilineaceae bacterium]|nr:hypothetical protein [Caldilineaceae bacterium]
NTSEVPGGECAPLVLWYDEDNSGGRNAADELYWDNNCNSVLDAGETVGAVLGANGVMDVALGDNFANGRTPDARAQTTSPSPAGHAAASLTPPATTAPTVARLAMASPTVSTAGAKTRSRGMGASRSTPRSNRSPASFAPQKRIRLATPPATRKSGRAICTSTPARSTK